MFWIVRTTGDPMTLAPGLVKEIRRIDPDVAASQIQPLDMYVSDALAPRRFSLSLMAAFGVAALALAVSGIYAVVTYSVSQRARELSIRVALGASRWSLVRLVMSHGMSFISIGLVLGLGLATGVARLISSLLFGLEATDTVTFGQVTLVVAAVSMLACALPTVRGPASYGTSKSTTNFMRRMNA